jgi:hypothetical protein
MAGPAFAFRHCPPFSPCGRRWLGRRPRRMRGRGSRMEPSPGCFPTTLSQKGERRWRWRPHPHRPRSRTFSPPWEKVPEGRMRGACGAVTQTKNPPHPAAATFSHGGEKAMEPKRQGGLKPLHLLSFPKLVPASSTSVKLPPSPHRSEIMTSGWCGGDGCASGVVPVRDRTDRRGASGCDPQLRFFRHQPAAPARRSLTLLRTTRSEATPRRGRFTRSGRKLQQSPGGSAAPGASARRHRRCTTAALTTDMSAA